MKPTIIFVDNDLNLRESIKRILRLKPYRVLALESAQRCVEVLAATDVQVLITDLGMPGFDGQTLISYFKATKPEVVRIVLSGKLDLATALDLINKGEVFRCLEKPCPAPVLFSAIQDALKLSGKKYSGSTLVRAEKTSQSDSSHSNPTSLIRDALKDVEQLEQSFKDHCEQGRPISTK